ncbi:MAG: DUF1934 domain-containing protein [Ruminococcaceae bacterium]|nr:DUF1934 domain-containing protein [Oscillospiraceae bacterium]
MKAKVLQRSKITRYDGSFPSLSAFLLCPQPTALDEETADVRGEGAFTVTGEDVSLFYKEAESGFSVIVAKMGDAVTVTRGGSVLVFRCGARTAFDYRTAYGILPTEAYTEDVTLQRKGSTYLFTLIYIAVFGGMAQKNELRFKITV